MTRRHDIDWLRVIAIGLLLIYHIAIAFQPWGVLIGFIQNNETLESIWVPMSMLNVWRIPLLFFVSGMGVCFAIQKRNLKQLIVERSKRILLPFVFGMLAIVPLHLFIWQRYYHQDLSYWPNPGHLWFLGNIFIYVLLLSPLFMYLKKNGNPKLKRLFQSPIGLLIIMACFVIEAVLMKPEPFELYATTWHGFVLGLLAFLFGFCLAYSGEQIWQNLLKWKWLLVSLAASLFMIRLFIFELQAPVYLVSIESSLWIFSVFAFAYQYLNCPSKALSYLSQAVYPVYIIHMIWLHLASYFLFPTDIPTGIQLVLVIIFTAVGCFAMYEFVIRRINFLRPLFGLKSKSKTNHQSVVTSNAVV
ncbi:MAG: acyltransferase [Bacteroidota bacterium]